MGWIALALLIAAAIGALVLLGLRRPLWSMAGAALMLGAVGYAWQGRPTWPAAPAEPERLAEPPAPAFIALRDAMIGRYTGDAAYLVASDAMVRAGDRRAAIQALLGGIAHIPESLMLWTSLGIAYAEHDGNRVSPPALFAFQHAMRLSPQHPAPPFFLGMAYAREGDLLATRRWWRRALAVTPATASYRPAIEGRLRLVEQITAGQ